MRIGFAGIGDMGLPMARRLLAQGHELTIWNRSPEKGAALLAEGASLAKRLVDLMSDMDLLGLCVSSDQVVEQIAFGADGLFSGGGGRCRAIADFTTGAPEAARSFAARASQSGVGWVDAPVSGGVPAAIAGSLVVFAGGRREDIDLLAPLFSAVAARVTRMGESGSGQTTKLFNNMIVSSGIAMIAEVVMLARRCGVDPAVLAPALKGGWADSLLLQIFGPRMASGTSEPRLGAIGLMHKDVRLALALAQEAGASVPLLHRVEQLYSDAIDLLGIDSQDDITRLVDAADAR